MIAKITQGGGFQGVVNYILDKKDARLLHGEGVRLKDRRTTIQDFNTQSKLKPKITKPVAHISLDFSVQDKHRLTDQSMIRIAQEYLDKMGYGNTQYIVVRHFDTDHPHIHLVINRIDNNGNRISDQKEKLRSTKICMEITKKYGFYIAKGKENVKVHRLREPDKSRYEIYYSLKSAIPKSKNWLELRVQLQNSGISTEFRKNGNTEKIQGVRFGKNGYEFNGSKIDRAFSYSKINYQLQQNLLAEQISLDHQHKPGQTQDLSDVAGATISYMRELSQLMDRSADRDKMRSKEKIYKVKRQRGREEGRGL
ncbi:relaxase/mobilization nuclease domain-containing protein [uncultured Draconibacterium sp.]|mgnify:CR=1 FL=1|uniref:relaxase/mobilization nuclease domain-containing protein n=1 Tax=uncultured Draconibacterium sp. TaxID=1573823 RepID=UPI0025E8F371|nr:relaxase/mobilization nuclease domain-containing protein [uncultured Draconibacterium sp.]